MKNSSRILPTLILLGALHLPAAAAAAPIGLIELTYACGDFASACVGAGLNDLDIASDPTVMFSNSQTYHTSAFDLAFSGNSRAGFGAYGADVSATYLGGVAPFLTTVQVGAGSLDRLTISDPLYDGQPGWLGIDWTLDGSMNSSGQGDTQLTIQDCVRPAGSLTLLSPPNGSAPGCNHAAFGFRPGLLAPVDFYSEPYLPFVFGTPFDLRTRFTVWSIFQGTGAGTASVDYLHTITLAGLNVFTADGTALSDPLFVSESSTRYSTRGVVPEPASLLLVGTGGLFLIARLRRRKHRV